MISYTHGNVQAAVYTLSEAGEYAPFDEEQTARLKAWEAHQDSISAKQDERRKARGRQVEKRIEKAKGMIFF